MGKKTTGPKLTDDQRVTLLAWLAADYDWSLIVGWFKDRDWPELDRSMATYYRKQYAIDIEQIRKDRRDKAFITGLAIKAERVERLKHHADALEVIKWEPDKNGKLWNEKAWRETLDQIADEMGEKKQTLVIDDGLTDDQRTARIVAILDAARERRDQPPSGANQDR